MHCNMRQSQTTVHEATFALTLEEGWSIHTWTELW
jgi:hypothetical protein